MNDEAVETLFRAMSKILNNQREIMKHMCISVINYDNDYGYGDEQLEDIISSCDNLAYRYSHEE